MEEDFKPNIYPIMYWALAYGAAAGVGLFLLQLLSRYIGVVWVPVFLAGLVWGGYKNYKRQKTAWRVGVGVSAQPQSALNEFREAAKDVFNASRDMMAEQQAEDAARQAQLEQELIEQGGEVPVAPEQGEILSQEQTSEEELPPSQNRV